MAMRMESEVPELREGAKKADCFDSWLVNLTRACCGFNWDEEDPYTLKEIWKVDVLIRV